MAQNDKDNLNSPHLKVYFAEVRQRRRLTPEGEISLAKSIEAGRKMARNAACSCPVAASTAAYLATRLENHLIVPRRIFANQPLNGHKNPDSPDRIEELLHYMQGIRTNLQELAYIENDLQPLFLSGISKDISPGFQLRILRHRNRIRSLISRIPFSPYVEENIQKNVEIRIETIQKIQKYLSLSARYHKIPTAEFHHWWLCGKIFPESGIPEWLYKTKEETGPQRLEIARICGALATDAASFQKNSLLMKIGNQHRKDAIHEMAECNLRLVLRSAKKAGRESLPIADRIQNGNIGLIKAADKFEWRRKNRFSTYAVKWISQQIQRATYDNLSTIKKPAHIIEAGKRVRNIRMEALRRGITLSDEQIANRSGISLHVLKNLDLVQDATTSINEQYSAENTSTLEEVLIDNEIETSEEFAIARQRREQIMTAVFRLPQKWKDFCMLHFGLQSFDDSQATQEIKEMSVREIASLWKVSVDSVKQIQIQALEALNTGELRAIASEI